MTKRLLNVQAAFLERLADSAEPVDIGECGPRTKYDKREAKVIGPAVAGLQSSGLIVHADAKQSSRPTRNGTIVWRWLATCRDSCRREAAEIRKRADSMPDDDDDGPDDPRQMLLF